MNKNELARNYVYISIKFVYELCSLKRLNTQKDFCVYANKSVIIKLNSSYKEKVKVVFS